jgi:hypothetical protein
VTGDQEVTTIDDPKLLIDTSRIVQEIRAKVSKELLESFGETNRISIVANLVKAQPSYDVAASLLLELCNIDLRLNDHSDLQFQVNRRLELDAGVKINRIMRFAVEVQRAMAVTVSADSGETLSQSPIGDERIFTSLALDFNTNPDGKVFRADHALRIFSSIADELLRVAGSPSVSSLND